MTWIYRIVGLIVLSPFLVVAAVIAAPLAILGLLVFCASEAWEWMGGEDGHLS